MAQFTIFLDDGGVMNDNLLRAPQWRRLVGEFFIPRLGGTPEAWHDANKLIIDQLLEPQAWQIRIQSSSNYKSFDRTYQLDWLGGMCRLIGLPVLPEETCIDLANQATAYIIRRVHSTFPGVIETIRMLSAQGYILHTASGEPSTELDGHLEAMGVRDCFGCLYGPDLIDTFKNGPAYYERIFADLALNPAEALVVDDSPLAARWAAQVGAQAVLINNQADLTEEKIWSCKSLADLPNLLL
jgi:HAD superfamily hydrolase (TIGR01509 family)